MLLENGGETVSHISLCKTKTLCVCLPVLLHEILCVCVCVCLPVHANNTKSEQNAEIPPGVRC